MLFAVGTLFAYYAFFNAVVDTLDVGFPLLSGLGERLVSLLADLSIFYEKLYFSQIH